MAKLFNLARMTTATTGTGTITLGAAVAGYLTFAAAGVANGDVVAYGISDGANSEVGTGTYTSSGTTLTRSVLTSTNSGSAISLTGTAHVFITALKEQIGNLQEANTWAASQTISPASGGASLSLNPAAASQQAIISFNQSGTGKWQIGKQTDDSFFLYDIGAAAYAFVANPSGYFYIGRHLVPLTNDGAALGVAGLAWSDASFATGAVLNFSSDVTATHAAGQFTFDGPSAFNFAIGAPTSTSGVFKQITISGSDTGSGAGGFIQCDVGAGTTFAWGLGNRSALAGGTYNRQTVLLGRDGIDFSIGAFGISVTDVLTLTTTALSPFANDGAALGTTTLKFSDLHLASGAVINFNAGDMTITHSTDLLAFAGGNYTFSDGQFTILNGGGATFLKLTDTTNTKHVWWIFNNGILDLYRTNGSTLAFTFSVENSTFIAGGEIRAKGDVGGQSTSNTFTGTSDLTANSTGVGSIKFKGATSRDSSGFIKVYIGTTAYYVPAFSAISG